VTAPIQCSLAGVEFSNRPLEFIDVSFGGLRICCDEGYRIGAHLHLDIFVPSATPVAVTAEVVWIAPLGQGAPARFEVGLSFVDLNTDALKFLMSVLDSEVEGVGLPRSKAEQGPGPTKGSVEPDSHEPVGQLRPDDNRPTDPPSFDLGAFACKVIAPHVGGSLGSERARPPLQLREPGPEWPSIASAVHGAVDAVASSSTLRVGGDAVEEMRESFSFGDYARALTIADRILAAQPSHPVARAFRADCCAALEDVYAFRLGPMNRIPMVAKVPALTDPLSAIDHRTGLLLSLIDGSSTLETIVDACGMPRVDALCVLYNLVQKGIVAFERSPA
jgi:Tfp pilus assembly protein PilZ